VPNITIAPINQKSVVMKDARTCLEKVGFVEGMVPNLTIALMKDAPTYPNVQVEFASDIAPKRRKIFEAVQNITSKSIPFTQVL